MFRPFFDWLEKKIAKDDSYGFYQPYKNDLGGVCPEAWHLSFKPVSENYLNEFSFDMFKEVISNAEIKYNEILLERADEIYEKFVLNIES